MKLDAVPPAYEAAKSDPRLTKAIEARKRLLEVSQQRMLREPENEVSDSASGMLI